MGVSIETIVLCFLSAVLMAACWKSHHNEASRRRAEKQREDAKHRLRQEIERMSLTCRRCGKAARPVPKTRNRYLCQKCGLRFVGDRHDLVDIDGIADEVLAELDSLKKSTKVIYPEL